MNKLIKIFSIVSVIFITGTFAFAQVESDDYIGDKAARNIALNHSRVNKKDVTFINSKLDWEDGIVVYEIKFYTKNNKQYEYDINASTGEVIKFDFDFEDDIPFQNNSAVEPPSVTENVQTSGGPVSPEQAKNIAVSKVPGASLKNIVKFKKDYDRGFMKYEGKIIFNNMEYEFEIDSTTGNIIEWDVDSVWD